MHLDAGHRRVERRGVPVAEAGAVAPKKTIFPRRSACDTEAAEKVGIDPAGP
jgi:hypothetical protein